MLVSPFLSLEQPTTFKQSMIDQLSNLINRNRSAVKISQVLCSTGHMLDLRSTRWRSPSQRSSAVWAQDLRWGNILPVVPVTQVREQRWEREIPSVVNISPLFTAIFSVWSSEIFLLLTINDYQLVSRFDSVLRSWRFILWDLELKFGSIQLVGHFCLFNNIQKVASDYSKHL